MKNFSRRAQPGKRRRVQVEIPVFEGMFPVQTGNPGIRVLLDEQNRDGEDKVVEGFLHGLII
jgi:hypothetical protein